jgi:hypothetical protein
MANGCTDTPGDGQEKMQFFWWMSSHWSLSPNSATRAPGQRT